MNSATNEIYELVFEELAEEDALHLAGKLLQRHVAPRSSKDATLDEELPALAISDRIVVERPHIRVLCYGDSIYDVEVNFTIGDIESVERSRLAEDLQAFAMKLTESIGSTTFFAGLEPASDEDTRIFTGNQLGPLYLRAD